MSERKVTRKICLLGDPAVGKTSLIHKFVYDVFDDKYLGTIGAKITKKTSIVEFPESDTNIELSLLIWDIAGQKMLGNVHQSYYRGAHGALVVADVTRKETFENIVTWISEMFSVVPGIPVLVLANKYDLKEKATIGEQHICTMMDKLGVSFLFTSAKSGLNVENAFNTIAKYLAQPIAEQQK